MLFDAFDGYCSAGNFKLSDHCISHPFLFQVSIMPDDDPLKEEIIVIQHNDVAKMAFEMITWVHHK